MNMQKKCLYVCLLNLSLAVLSIQAASSSGPSISAASAQLTDPRHINLLIAYRKMRLDQRNRGMTDGEYVLYLQHNETIGTRQEITSDEFGQLCRAEEVLKLTDEQAIQHFTFDDDETDDEYLERLHAEYKTLRSKQQELEISDDNEYWEYLQIEDFGDFAKTWTLEQYKEWRDVEQSGHLADDEEYHEPSDIPSSSPIQETQTLDVDTAKASVKRIEEAFCVLARAKKMFSPEWNRLTEEYEEAQDLLKALQGSSHHVSQLHTSSSGLARVVTFGDQENQISEELAHYAAYARKHINKELCTDLRSYIGEKGWLHVNIMELQRALTQACVAQNAATIMRDDARAQEDCAAKATNLKKVCDKYQIPFKTADQFYAIVCRILCKKENPFDRICQTVPLGAAHRTQVFLQWHANLFRFVEFLQKIYPTVSLDRMPAKAEWLKMINLWEFADGVMQYVHGQQTTSSLVASLSGLSFSEALSSSSSSSSSSSAVSRRSHFDTVRWI